jgi:hypothetical protein
LAHEFLHAGVGEQPSLADDDQVISCQGHLAHQVAGGGYGPALGSWGAQQRPDARDPSGSSPLTGSSSSSNGGAAPPRDAG